MCPASNASYFVDVSDTGSAGELARAPATARATLTADVVACADGGVVPSSGRLRGTRSHGSGLLPARRHERNLRGRLAGAHGNGGRLRDQRLRIVRGREPRTALVDFDFAGGKLGVLANDLAAGDNTTGESAGGVSPAWRITYLSGCP
jgi:hypothetical protein